MAAAKKICKTELWSYNEPRKLTFKEFILQWFFLYLCALVLALCSQPLQYNSRCQLHNRVERLIFSTFFSPHLFCRNTVSKIKLLQSSLSNALYYFSRDELDDSNRLRQETSMSDVGRHVSLSLGCQKERREREREREKESKKRES